MARQPDLAAKVKQLVKAENARRERLVADLGRQREAHRVSAAKTDEYAAAYNATYETALQAWGAQLLKEFGFGPLKQPSGTTAPRRRSGAGREPG
ncbi:hypothetical protein [Longispora albida]|uniref:hypothetical protein n=1 Tax=Longispora albida TaxID=203523 RepID=UPI0003A0A974|nr:hypothetical protein [Longispora albida]